MRDAVRDKTRGRAARENDGEKQDRRRCYGVFETGHASLTTPAATFTFAGGAFGTGESADRTVPLGTTNAVNCAAGNEATETLSP